MRRSRLSSLTRRLFIGGLASVPVWSSRVLADETPTVSSQFRRAPPPVTSADQLVNVMEFEPLARDALPPAHFGYIATGADDDRTVVRNHEAFAQYEIRARRFNDLSHLDPSISLFGASSPSPIYLSAVSAMRAFYAEGELAVARAARTRSMQLMLSTGTSTAIEAINEARGAPIWQQLYPTDDWSVTAGIVRRAEGVVSNHGGRNEEPTRGRGRYRHPEPRARGNHAASRYANACEHYPRAPGAFAG
jgi:FMN-dependent dehydrogenase